MYMIIYNNKRPENASPQVGIRLGRCVRLAQGKSNNPLDPKPWTQNPTPSTLNPKAYTLNPKSYTLNLKSYTLNLKPYTPPHTHPKPLTLHPKLLHTLNTTP